MMAGQCPATFSSYSMAECDSAKKYLQVHNGEPTFWVPPAGHARAQLIFQNV